MTINKVYVSKQIGRGDRVLTFVTLGFIICVYPLIYQLYSIGSVSTLNKVVLFTLITVYATKNRYFLKKLFSSSINSLLSFSMLYILLSISVYSVNLSTRDFFRELLYTLAPVIFFFIAESFSREQQNYFVKIVVLCLCFVILVGVLDLFGFRFSSVWINALEKKGKANFISYYSPITMGYVAQFLYALTLFRMSRLRVITNHRFFFLVLFLVISILTLQRAAYLGLVVCTLTYYAESIYKAVVKRRSTVNKRKAIALLILLLFILLMIVFVDWKSVGNTINDLLGFNIKNYVQAELNYFMLDNVQYTRRNQAIIFNKNNIFNVLLGEGYGKYSPNNMNSICRMPDASYFRIYNELGIIGFILFFSPYLLMFFDAIKRKKAFAVYFNRVLWAIPISYIIYPMLSICRIDVPSISDAKEFKNDTI